MNRIFVLAVGALLAGCAADFGDEGTGNNVPDQNDQENTIVKPYSGELQRPTPAVGTVDDRPDLAQAKAIDTYYERLNQVDTERFSK